MSPKRRDQPWVFCRTSSTALSRKFRALPALLFPSVRDHCTQVERSARHFRAVGRRPCLEGEFKCRYLFRGGENGRETGLPSCSLLKSARRNRESTDAETLHPPETRHIFTKKKKKKKLSLYVALVNLNFLRSHRWIETSRVLQLLRRSINRTINLFSLISRSTRAVSGVGIFRA